MARRRKPAVVESDAPTVPAELRACIVEDWLTAREVLGDVPHGLDPVVVAWGRWRDARREWMAESGATSLDVPTCRPQWREPHPIETTDSAKPRDTAAKRKVFP